MAKKKAAAKKAVKKAVKATAKKKIAKKVVKKAAPKRPVAAAKTAKTKKKVTNLTATKKKTVVAVKTKKTPPKATKPAKPKPAAAKPVVKKTVAPKPVARKPVVAKPVAAKPAAAPLVAKPVAPVPVPTHHSNEATPLFGDQASCAWTISDFKATFSESSTVTRFHYVRTNPVDAEVKIGFACTNSGPVDHYLGDQQDKGYKDCSGTPTEWNACELIPSGREVSIQLFENGMPMTSRAFTIVQSVP